MSADYTVERDWTTKAGLRAVVTMGSMGFRCGYVGVPAGHPLHGVDYNDVRIGADYPDVHGGLTYGAGNDGYPVDAPGLWWLGYDCGHSGDAPSDEYREAQRAKYPQHPILWEHRGHYEVHRDLAYCVRQCEALAEQIVRARAADAGGGVMRRGNKPERAVLAPAPSCPTCNRVIPPGTVIELDRQDGNLEELESAARAQGFVIGAGVVAFVFGAALLLWGVL